MDEILFLNDVSSESFGSRRRQARHCRHLSLGGFSAVDDDGEHLKEIIDRKASATHDASRPLVWASSGDSCDEGPGFSEEDDREDARGFLSSEDESQCERVLSHDEIGTTLRHDIARPAAISCFRRAVSASCPEMPSFHEGLLDTQERLNVRIRRTRAFTEDDDDINRISKYQRWSSSSDESGNSDSRSIFLGGADSVHFESSRQNENPTDSPTATWLFWESTVDSSIKHP